MQIFICASSGCRWSDQCSVHCCMNSFMPLPCVFVMVFALIQMQYDGVIYIFVNASVGDMTASASSVHQKSSNVNLHTPATTLCEVHEASSIQTISARSGENICVPVFFFEFLRGISLWLSVFTGILKSAMLVDICYKLSKIKYLILSYVWQNHKSFAGMLFTMVILLVFPLVVLIFKIIMLIFCCIF